MDCIFIDNNNASNACIAIEWKIMENGEMKQFENDTYHYHINRKLHDEIFTGKMWYLIF